MGEQWSELKIKAHTFAYDQAKVSEPAKALQEMVGKINYAANRHNMKIKCQ